jgi:hypothetical protein
MPAFSITSRQGGPARAMQAGHGRLQRISRISRPFYNTKTFTAPQQRESIPAIGRKLAAQVWAADWIFCSLMGAAIRHEIPLRCDTKNQPA